MVVNAAFIRSRAKRLTEENKREEEDIWKTILVKGRVAVGDRG
jgi:hypothetical protein